MFWRYDDLKTVEMLPGVSRRNLAVGEKMMVCEIRLKKGAEVPWHSHPHEQVGHVASGRLQFWIGDEERTLGHGQIVLAPAGQPHGVFNDGPGRLVLLVYMAPNPTPGAMDERRAQSVDSRHEG